MKALKDMTEAELAEYRLKLDNQIAELRAKKKEVQDVIDSRRAEGDMGIVSDPNAPSVTIGG